MDTWISNLTLVCDRVSTRSDWITSLQEALAGVEGPEAAWKPSADESCIWEIVCHTIAWTRWVVSFLQGQDVEVTDWPPLGSTEEAAWEQTCRDLTDTLSAFREQVAALVPEDLWVSPTPEVTQTNRFVGIQSILIHNAYHAGQITRLRAAYRRLESVTSADGVSDGRRKGCQ